MRAERRTGELLRELARADISRGGSAPNDAGPTPTSPYAEALQRTGISSQSASRYQALADVPQATFEAALREPEKPTTNAERRACEIRLRAERRTGELLRELARAPSGARNPTGRAGKEPAPNDATQVPSAYAEAIAGKAHLSFLQRKYTATPTSSAPAARTRPGRRGASDVRAYD